LSAHGGVSGGAQHIAIAQQVQPLEAERRKRRVTAADADQLELTKVWGISSRPSGPVMVAHTPMTHTA
jgi:hypothetical protein